MKYIVMECHKSYAILLDEEGRFCIAANLRYETGQTVTEIVEMKEIQQSGKKSQSRNWAAALATAAACLALVVFAVFPFDQLPYASVYMTINPQVRIDVNRHDVVVGLEGLNEDGQMLIDGYEYQKKALDPVVDELVDRAIEMGYLSSGESITLELDAEDNEWVVTTGDHLGVHLDEYLTDKLTVTIQVAETDEAGNQILHDVNRESDLYGEIDYGDTDYGPDSDGVTDYEEADDSNHSNDSDGVTDYDGENGDNTDYKEDDGASAYEASDDGQTDYGTSEQSDDDSDDDDDDDDGDD